MLLTPPLPPHLDRTALHARRSEWLARTEIPSRLMDARRFADFCAKRGIEGLHPRTLLRLWHAGWVRADLVLADADLEPADFPAVPGRLGWHTDARPPACFDPSWDEALAEAPLPARGVRPLFHVHRFPLLLALGQLLEVRVPGAIRLYSLERLGELAARAVAPRPWEDLGEAWETLQTWCELAVALAPREAQGTRTTDLLQEVGESGLRAIHVRLCEAALELDDNRDVHTLLRFVDAHRRAGITGRLGACLQLLEMAELVRRATERALEIELPEEDDAAAGGMLEGAKKKIYGSTRLLDDDFSAKSLMRLLQLEARLKVRCYVEGAPEYGALRAALRHVPGVSLLDLRAQLVDVERRDGAFAESLRDDMRTFCEDARFAFEDLLARVEKCSTASALFRRLEAVPELDVRRDERWGEALLALAQRLPNRPDGAERPLVSFVREVVHATRVPHTCAWDRLRVDPTTGRLIERQQ